MEKVAFRIVGGGVVPFVLMEDVPVRPLLAVVVILDFFRFFLLAARVPLEFLLFAGAVMNINRYLPLLPRLGLRGGSWSWSGLRMRSGSWTGSQARSRWRIA